MSETSNHEERPEHKEPFVETLGQRVKEVFPDYSVMDRSEYDAYNPDEDETDKGQIIYFYTEQGKTKNDPSIFIIFKDEGFVINYYNSPEPKNPYSLRNKSDSLFRGESRWQESELDLALEKAKIHMEGIDHENESFRLQLAGWSSSEDRFLTIGERMDSNKQRLQGASFKERQRILLEGAPKRIWDLLTYNPDKATELAIERISQKPEYTSLDGVISPSSEIIDQVKLATGTGKAAVLREINIIAAYESLLRQKELLI